MMIIKSRASLLARRLALHEATTAVARADESLGKGKPDSWRIRANFLSLDGFMAWSELYPA
jgi:hypothetical protein